MKNEGDRSWNQEAEAQFLLDLVHDLRSHLRRVLTRAQLMERTPPALPEPHAGNLTEIIDSARGLQQFLARLSEYAAAGLPSRSSSLPLMAVLQSAVLQAAALQTDGFEVDLKPLPDDLSGVSVPDVLIKALAELIANAAKFRRQPGLVSLSAHWVITDESALEILVEDDGIGIDAAEAALVLQPLHRLHSKDEFPGEGLGLSICRRIVESLGGRLELRPRQPQGTAAVLRIPLT